MKSRSVYLVVVLGALFLCGWGNRRDCFGPIPVDYVCCNGVVVMDYLCCGNRVTGPDEICCGGSNITNVKTELCCAGRVYPQNKVDCCDGSVAPEGTCSTISPEAQAKAEKNYEDFVVKGDSQ